MIQILAGLITYLLLAIYCHEEHGERVSKKGSGSYETKFSMRPGAQSRNNPILITSAAGQYKIYMQVLNRTLLGLPLTGTNGVILLGGLLFIFDNLSFGASEMLCNAFLPDIAGPGDRDRISSLGWAAGYLGGGIALAAALAGFAVMDDKGLAVRIGLAFAGAWWLIFTLVFPARYLRRRTALKKLHPGETYFRQSTRQIVRILGTIYRVFPETFNQDYAARKFAEDARRRARRRTLVLQVPDNKADSVNLRAPCGFECLRIYHGLNFIFWVKG